MRPAMPVMPCGYRREGIKLKDRLTHYRACADAACKARAEAWDALVVEASKPGAVRIIRTEARS